jgi:S-DNA-T family DNA segregation ATPase FtsK/SpoIIIE
MASDSPEKKDSKTQAKPKASIVVASKRAQAPKKAAKPKGRLGRFFSTPAGVVAALCLFFAFYLSLTLWLAALWPKGWAFLVRPGILLKSSFSWASWFLPLWILCAGIMAALPKAHPRFAYILASSALPFLVLAGFARISTEPGPFFENHPVFAAVGLSSLYAGFGFLFALAVGLVGFGFFRLTLWMRATGKLPEKNSGRNGKAGKNGKPVVKEKKPLPWVLLGRRISAWNSARKEKKSQAERRLDSAQAIAAKPFAFEMPNLPTVEELKTRDTLPDPVPDSLPAALRTSLSGAEGEKPSLMKEIEFISVPPQTVTGGSGAIKDEEKSALIQRILDRKKEKPYAVPVDGVLNTYPDGKYWVIDDKTRLNAEVLTETLAEFKIEAEVTGISKGPVITMYEILPAHGVKISKITNLADNIALRLAASSVRIVAPIPGKHAVGIEVPNAHRSVVSLREIIEHEQFQTAKMAIPIALGKDIQGVVQFTDLNQMPHLLIAGATGSGKSVCVNALILSILYRRSPEEVKLILIDPKIVELKLYNGIPHLLTPVITEPKRAFQALQYCIFEMQRRYSMLSKLDVRDISTYNKKIKDQNLAQEKLPFLVVVIDEFASLMANSGKELEDTVHKISALARAVGIHLVLATQRPSVDVITGLIKANIPARIAFMVSSKFDSRVIIDMVGAEKLLGKGDMLYSGSSNPFPIRMQCAFVSEEEVERAVAHVKTLGEPEYIDDEIFYDEEEEALEPSLFDDGEGDPLFEKALEIVLQQGKASASFIQRRLKIGYNRSARLVELMEERGIVGPAQGSKPREVIQNPDHIPRSDAGRAARSLSEEG